VIIGEAGRRRARTPTTSWGFAGTMGLGTLAALFFALSFVINRMMAVGGGAWEWSACLRFLFSLPVFAAIVAARGGLPAVVRILRADPVPWMLWSTVGFGVFYAPMCLAAVTAPGWAVAATWQITIVCGMLLAPFLYDDQRRRIPVSGMLLSAAILAGVALTQFGRDTRPSWGLGGGIVAVLVAAVAYPVGNRKTMSLAGERIDTFQRLLAMSLASLPFWLLIATVGVIRPGMPRTGQLAGTAIVAVCSGVMATAAFFSATYRVRQHPLRLAGVEATQAGEVVFVAVAEPLMLTSVPPGRLSWIGIAIITAGVLGHALTGHRAAPDQRPSDPM
jgi:drug/metabolite transporter (DMT)-like permease